MTRREKLLGVAAIVAIPIALVLVVLAIDLLRTPGWISDDDNRFSSARSIAAW